MEHVKINFCVKYEPSNIRIENSNCTCGREKWYHPTKKLYNEINPLNFKPKQNNKNRNNFY